jgi:hypothetical protein
LEEARAEEAQEFDSIHEPRYQTLWVTRDASGKLVVLATVPELIVPRRDGFWHVGVKQVCEFDPGVGEDGGNESIIQIVWAAVVTEAAEIEQIHPCTAHKLEDYAPPYGRSKEDRRKISQCGYRLADIEFVSPELISLRNYASQSESCEARGGRYAQTYHVENYDSNSALGFGALLGAAAGKAYSQAIPKKAHSDFGGECGEPYQTSDDGWRIGRNGGRWAPFVSQSLGNFGCSVDAPIHFRLPTSVTGETAVISDWKPFQAKEPDLQDGFIAPSGDLAIVVTKSEMKFYEIAAGVPERMLLALPAHPIVMVQWSTGKHVAGWTTQLEKIAKQHLPEPVIQVKPKEK